MRDGVASSHANRLDHDQRLEVLDRISAGESRSEVGLAVGCSQRTVARVLAAAGGRPSRRSRRRRRSALRLSLIEREEIGAGIAAGDSFRAIGRRIGRHASTISREVGGSCGRDGYRATKAEDRAVAAACRPKRSKLATNPRLRRRVGSMLCKRFSPEQISARLKLDHPGDEEMRISPETIYQSLYVQSRGRFRRDLSSYLRTGRAKRKPQASAASGRGKIAEMVMISERPAEVADRAVPGHWEGDLIVGRANGSFIATLVERQTRFVMLAGLADAKTETVCAAIAKQIQRLPAQLRRSLTWDQGSEMAGHRAFSVATGVDVYFCEPHSPWQRGSNENTNGLLRQYFPKATDLAVHGQIELDQVAAELNCRPRQTLDWANPAEKMAQLLQ